MRRIITITLMSLGLTGGVALADNHARREPAPTVRDHRGYDRGFQRGFERGNDRGYARGEQRGERIEHFRDYNRRPEVRFERHDERAGFRFMSGQWSWNGYEWIWLPGHYVRLGVRF